MEKTAKTMAELEIDMNVAYEFSALTESGTKPAGPSCQALGMSALSTWATAAT